MITRLKLLLKLGAIWCVIVVALLLLSCDESLPPRDDPQNFLGARISTSGGPVTVYVPDVVFGGTIRIEVTNLLDEVLEADSSVWVTVEMWPKGFPDRMATIVAGPADLQTPWMIHGGLLTLTPDSPAVFIKQWSQRTDDGTPMWVFGGLTRQYTANHTPYCASDPIHVIARATVKLFKHVAPIDTPETELVFIYHVFGIEC